MLFSRHLFLFFPRNSDAFFPAFIPSFPRNSDAFFPALIPAFFLGILMLFFLAESMFLCLSVTY